MLWSINTAANQSIYFQRNPLFCWLHKITTSNINPQNFASYVQSIIAFRTCNNARRNVHVGVRMENKASSSELFGSHINIVRQIAASAAAATIKRSINQPLMKQMILSGQSAERREPRRNTARSSSVAVGGASASQWRRGATQLGLGAEPATRHSARDQFSSPPAAPRKGARYHAVLPTRKQQQLGRPPQAGDGHSAAGGGAADAPAAPSHVGATLATIHAPPGKNFLLFHRLITFPSTLKDNRHF